MKSNKIKLTLSTIFLSFLLIFLSPPLTESYYSFPTKIDTLDERINIQVVLNTVLTPSPNLIVDGVLGRKSIQAIQSFQESRGLVPDGKVGPITRSALEQAQGVTTTTTSSNTNTSTSTTGCIPGGLYNTNTGKPCTTTSSSNGCTSSTKYSPITGQYCGNTTTTTTTTSTTSGGGSTTNTDTNYCTGSSYRSCTISNGIGIQSRTCSNGYWSSFNSCTASSCNTGYQISGNTCTQTSCSGSSSQSCSITNGSGIQSRTCNSGTWSSYNSCTVSSCNSGYQKSGNTCVVIPITTNTPTTCSGSSTQSCTISNGSGTQSRTCTNGTWSSYNSCTVSTCNSGYQQSGNTCFVIPPSSPSSALPTGLVSWWSFDGNANDKQGINSGTPSSGLSQTSLGCRSGQCYMFDSNSDYITLSSSSTILNGTYAFWLTRGDVSDDRLIFASDAYQSRIFLTQGGYIRLETNTNGQEFQYYSATIPSGVLTHVLLSRSGNSMSMYINGVLSATTTVLGANGMTASQIGWNGRSFRGTLDEIMIWNRALSATEAQSVYTYFGNSLPICTPESSSTTCSDKCGTQTNNCGASVSCGVCTVTDATSTSNVDFGDKVVVFADNFENLPDMSSDTLMDKWQITTANYTEESNSIVNVGGIYNKVWQGIFHGGKYMGGNDDGYAFSIPLDKGYDELWLDYDIYADPDFNSVSTAGKYSGKMMPGFGGGNDVLGDGAWSENQSINGNGWVAHFVWGSLARLWPYYYDQFGSGKTLNPEDSIIPNGRWVHGTVRIKVNTPGQPNGIFEYYINGELKAQKTDIVWRSSSQGYDRNKIEFIFTAFVFGGGGADYISPRDNYVRLDNLIAYYYKTTSSNYLSGPAPSGKTAPIVRPTTAVYPNKLLFDETFTSSSGTIKTHYIGSYSPYSWDTIEKKIVRTTGPINIKFTDFNAGWDVWPTYNSWTKVYSGTGSNKQLLYKFDKYNLPLSSTYSINSNSVTLEYFSGWSHSKGWTVQYTSN